MKRDRSDCLGCILRIPLLLGSIPGWSPVTTECPHRDSPAVRFRTSLILRAISTTLYVPYLAYFFVAALDILWWENSDPRYLLIICDVLMIFSAFVKGVGAILKVRQRVDELNGLAAIVGSRRRFGVDSFFGGDQVRRIGAVVRLTLGLSCLGAGYMAYSIISQKSHTQRDCRFIQGYVMVFSIAVTYAEIFQYLLCNYLYEVLFRSCFQTVKESLPPKQPSRSGGIFLEMNSPKQSNPGDVSLEAKLKRAQRLYLALVHNYKKLNKFYDPILLIGTGVLVIVIIINFILELIYSRDGVSDAPVFAKYFMGCVGITVALYSARRVNSVGEDMVGFLYKYPLSALCPEEAEQVKTFMVAVTVRKPSLVLSDLLTMDTKLVAPIFGTVVTYVLVALQFHVQN